MVYIKIFSVIYEVDSKKQKKNEIQTSKSRFLKIFPVVIDIQ